MTLLGSATNGTIDRAEIWGLAGPTAGTHQITVTVANAGGQNTALIAGAKSFTQRLPDRGDWNGCRRDRHEHDPFRRPSPIPRSTTWSTPSPSTATTR